MLNPLDGKGIDNLWGTKLLIKGEKTFFLRPGEELVDNQIFEIEILGEDEALLV